MSPPRIRRTVTGFIDCRAESRNADQAYDAMFDRVFAKIAGGALQPGAAAEAPPVHGPRHEEAAAAPAEFAAILERCQRLRYDDPAGMVELARFAAVHLRQGRLGEARNRASEALAAFSRLDVGREAMAALLVLRDAFERRLATAALLDGVIARLARLEREPAA